MLKSSASRIFTTIALAGVVALSLVACSSSSTDAAAACTPTKSGTASAKIDVKGKFGKSPTVTFSTPLKSTKTQRTVEIKGSSTGKTAVSGSAVTINYAVYNATSGKEIDTTGFGKSKAQPLQLDKTSIIPGLYKAVKCATPGTRITSVIPPVDAFGTTGQTSLGVAATDSIVFVIDVQTVKAPVKALSKANGTPVAAKKGYPTVKLAKSGEPTIAVPKTTAPTKLMITDLKKGSGATVKTGASVTVQYTGVIWDTGKVFDSSWTSGTPATFTTTQVVTGFGKALVGQKVGSQVIAVIPPDEGYGTTGQSAAGISGTDTLVFVIDILATQ
ncbi:FKBP-type peptidyl-prolyl cis-trans isomerase [soil metagenome]